MGPWIAGLGRKPERASEKPLDGANRAPPIELWAAGLLNSLALNLQAPNLLGTNIAHYYLGAKELSPRRAIDTRRPQTSPTHHQFWLQWIAVLRPGSTSRPHDLHSVRTQHRPLEHCMADLCLSSAGLAGGRSRGHGYKRTLGRGPFIFASRDFVAFALPGLVSGELWLPIAIAVLAMRRKTRRPLPILSTLTAL